MDGERLEVPAQAFLREHEVDRRALGLVAVGAVLERDADDVLAGGRHVAGFEPECVYWAMFSCSASMYFQPPPLPSWSPQSVQPGGDVEVAGARRRRVGHHDLALVDRLGQVLPGLGLRDVLLLRLDGVEADRRAPDVHAPPRRRALLVAVGGHDRVEVDRRVRHAACPASRAAPGSRRRRP